MHHHPMSLPLEHYQKLTNLIRDIIIEGLGKYNITLLLNCSGAECQSPIPVMNSKNAGKVVIVFQGLHSDHQRFRIWLVHIMQA